MGRDLGGSRDDVESGVIDDLHQGRAEVRHDFGGGLIG
jgi:hypothetical protein